MSVIFVFVDGVGLGDAGKHNPLVSGKYSSFRFMAGGQEFTSRAEPVQQENHCFKGIDACLDVEGLPQSGTGQVSLFSGENASKIIDRHFGPFPHSRTRFLLKEKSLFLKARQQGKSCYFMNAYPQIFFDHAKRRNRWSSTTLMTKSADISLNTLDDVKQGRAVTAGITQRAWRERLDLDVPVISPEEAAGRVIDMSGEKDLLLSEYYLTDKAGHAQDPEQASEVLNVLDAYLWKLIEGKRSEDTIVITSDHGNLEDLSIKTHTFNEVPLFVYGPGAKAFHKAKSILDVKEGILKVV